jgi:hypothetical protein
MTTQAAEQPAVVGRASFRDSCVSVLIYDCWACGWGVENVQVRVESSHCCFVLSICISCLMLSSFRYSIVNNHMSIRNNYSSRSYCNVSRYDYRGRPQDRDNHKSLEQLCKGLIHCDKITLHPLNLQRFKA